MHKVQITLTPEESYILEARANRLGYGITRYIKFLISREADAVVGDYPVISLSKKAIKKIDQAMKEHEEGRTIRIYKASDLDNL